MSTYRTDITYLDVGGSAHLYVQMNIVANSMFGATSLALDGFYASHEAVEIKKVIVELKESTRAALGDISITRD